MSINCVTLGDGLVRTTGSFLSTVDDYTVTFWAKVTTAPTAGTWKTFVLMYDTLRDNYLWIGQDDAGRPDLYVQRFAPGFEFTDIVGTALPTDAWAAFGITYTAATGEHTLYQRASSVSLTTVGTAAFTWGTQFSSFATERAGDDATPSQVPVGLAYYRSWQRQLTPAQILAELNSSMVVTRTDLFMDTPLPNPAHVEDLSGNGRDWTAVGSPVYIEGPLPLPDAAPWQLFEYAVKSRPEQRA